MNATHLLTSTCTVDVVTYTGPDDGFGDPTIVTTTRTLACWLSQRQRSEVTGNADTQQETWDLYLEPAAADIDGLGRVTVDGIVYELDGPPWPALNPRTRQITHVEATVRRTR